MSRGSQPSTATRRVFTTVVVTAVIAAAIGVGAGWFVRSPAQIAADAAPPPRTTLTADVTEGTIAGEAVFSGIVTQGTTVQLSPEGPAGGVGIVTAVPAPTGSTARPGAVLIEVNDRPVIFLNGAVPLLRDLRTGDKGEDVTRLQVALGPWGAPQPDGKFGARTLAALREMYKATGYFPPTAALRSELVFVPAATLTVVGYGSALGSPVVSPLVTATTSGPVVTANVSETASQVFAIGREVMLNGVAVGGETHGEVTHIGTLTKGDQGSFQVPVEIAAKAPIPSTAVGSAVEVTVPLAAGDSGLLVPLSALYSDASGGEFVLLKGDDSARVPVKVAETGGGQARVIPEADGELTVGDSVIIGKE